MGAANRRSARAVAPSSTTIWRYDAGRWLPVTTATGGAEPRVGAGVRVAGARRPRRYAALLGKSYRAQAFVFGETANPLSAVMSNALELRLGA